jgi:nucleoside-diphosphate-sugar epimerase
VAVVLILGANGRIGRNAALAFRDAGWLVRGFVRAGAATRLPAGVEPIEGDGRDAAAVAAAAKGADVVLNGLNVAYENWRAAVPAFTEAALAAMRASGALLMLPGNVYNFGAGMPPLLGPATPQKPTTEKGRIRATLEARLADAVAREGLRAAVIRAGDFYGGEGRGAWFDLVVAAQAARGVVTYPGPLDVVHAWAYLPDLARAFVAVAANRDRLPGFADLPFAGHAVTGRAFVAAIERALGRPVKLRGMPWRLLRIAGLFKRSLGEVVEMAYLWRVPHALDGATLEHFAGTLPATPLDAAVGQALAAMGPAADR